jgi:hypothetical protein
MNSVQLGSPSLGSKMFHKFALPKDIPQIPNVNALIDEYIGQLSTTYHIHNIYAIGHIGVNVTYASRQTTKCKPPINNHFKSHNTLTMLHASSCLGACLGYTKYLSSWPCIQSVRFKSCAWAPTLLAMW